MTGPGDKSGVTSVALMGVLGLMTLLLLMAWSAFTLDLFSVKLLPPSQALLAFALPASIGLLGLPPMRRGPVQVAALGLVVLSATHACWFAGTPLWDFSWVGGLIEAPRSDRAWLAMAATALWTAAFWLAGTRFSRTKLGYAEVCVRLDAGVAWLFGLIVARLLIEIQPDSSLHETRSMVLIQPIFVLGLVAVLLARSREGLRSTFVGGYRGAGILATWVGVLGGLAAATALVAAPVVAVWQDGMQAAELASWAEPVIRGVGAVFTFLFSLLGQAKLEDAMPSAGQVDEALRPVLGPGQGGNSAHHYRSLFNVAGAVFTTLVVGAGLWAGRHWLLRQWAPASSHDSVLGRLLRWLARGWTNVRGLVVGMAQRRRQHGAVRSYRALITWGRRSGMPARRSETPLEYEARLKTKWPSLGGEFDAIVSALNLHVYGPELCDGQALVRAHRALWRLRSPRLWRRRLALWLLGERNPSPSLRTG